MSVRCSFTCQSRDNREKSGFNDEERMNSLDSTVYKNTVYYGILAGYINFK